MDEAVMEYLGHNAASIKMWSQPKIVMTGFCGMGQCEGTKPKGPSGAALRTCPFWEACTCPCHDQVTQLFTLTGEPRVMVGNPDYVPNVSKFWMPNPDDFVNLPDAKPEMADNGDVVLVPKVVHVTPTGKTNRGGLEYLVQRECLAWMADQDGSLCTPKYLSTEIQRIEKTEKAPSMGAIDAVFKRWTAIGYAVIEKSPTRFVGLTEQGKADGLDRLKAMARK